MNDYQYCPRCGAEYRRGFTRCSDCGVALTDEPPVEPPETPPQEHPVYDGHHWIQDLRPEPLTAIGSELEAEMLLGLLRSNEVRAFSQNESSHGLSHYGGQAARSSALALYRIYVHPEDVAQARELLAEAGHDASIELDRQSAETIAAPATRRGRPGSTRRFVVAVAVLILLGSAVFSTVQIVTDGF